MVETSKRKIVDTLKGTAEFTPAVVKVKKIKLVDEAEEVNDEVAHAEEEIAAILEVADDVAGGDDLPCDVEADDDEDDPEMVECAKCGTMTHISVGRCSKEGCDYVFKFTASGHLMDGFVVGESTVEYEEGAVSESEEEYEDSDESDSDSDDSEEEEACPWADGDSDGSWQP